MGSTGRSPAAGLRWATGDVQVDDDTLDRGSLLTIITRSPAGRLQLGSGRTSSFLPATGLQLGTSGKQGDLEIGLGLPSGLGLGDSQPPPPPPPPPPAAPARTAPPLPPSEPVSFQRSDLLASLFESKPGISARPVGATLAKTTPTAAVSSFSSSFPFGSAKRLRRVFTSSKDEERGSRPSFAAMAPPPPPPPRVQSVVAGEGMQYRNNPQMHFGSIILL